MKRKGASRRTRRKSVRKRKRSGTTKSQRPTMYERPTSLLPLAGGGRIPLTLRVSSQKGGVGKTTISVNLATALSLGGYKVLLVDGDTVNPVISFLLDIDSSELGLKEVLSGKARLTDVMRRHDSTGMWVVPGVASEKSFLPSPQQVKHFINEIRRINDFDFVIIDTPPGFFSSSIEPLYEEALIVITPTIAACASAIRLSELYLQRGIRHEIVLNRVNRKRYEMSPQDVERSVGRALIARVPEDKVVNKGENLHIPAYIVDKGSPFSKAISDIAAYYSAKRGTPVLGGRGITPKRGFLNRLFGGNKLKQ